MKTRPNLPLPALFSKALKKYRVLSEARNIELGVEGPNKSRIKSEELFHGNLRLMKKIAEFYRCYGLDFHDVIQEGSLGLWIGSLRFDSRKGKFSSYVALWIK